jgi:8-oxo-dGTP pyrophosphatase MutT (NUDIX family)
VSGEAPPEAGRAPHAARTGSDPAGDATAPNLGSALASLRADAALRDAVTARLQAFMPQHATEEATHGLRRAAVALAITDAGHGASLSGMPQQDDWSTEAALILTRRPGGLRRHAGQWALPGGRLDPGETPEAAALRELAEEVGLRLGTDALLGRLDDYVSRSGFVITPWVVWAGPAHEMQADPAEVASIHRIPLSEFLRADAPILEPSAHGPHPVLKMPVGDTWIAAPTAALLYQFRELVVLGRPTRVAHFDQPTFAWT